MRVGLEAEELRALGAQGEDLGDRRVVVLRVAVVAPAVVGPPDLLAQVAPLGVGQEGLHARARVEDGPLPLLPARLGGGRRRGADGVGEAGEVPLALQEEHVVRLVREDVLGEASCRGVARRWLISGEALLPGRVEPRPRAGEGGVVEPRETLLLGGEPRALARLVDRGDPLEERLVLRDPVPERGEAGRHLALDRLELRRVHRGAPDAVDALHLLEHAVGALHRGDRVLEGGRRRLGRDPSDGRELLGHARLEGGLEAARPHLVERGDAAVGAGPGGEEGVRGGGRGGGEEGREAGLGQGDRHVG